MLPDIAFTAAAARSGRVTVGALRPFVALLGVHRTEECSALTKQDNLQGKVFFPDSVTYDARLESYYSANAALPPRCMVLPASTSDVSTITKIISKLQCPFGMRSGAHSAYKGSNSVDDGITIDFGYMNATTYDAETEIASIQPGATWGDAFAALDPYGVTVVGGRASSLGVGGFITGGGYSFHTGLKGFGADTVANFEIVLANGTVVNANANENADLWKAQKGSSGNLGFVTRIDMRTVSSALIWGGFVSYDLSKRDEVFNAYLNFADNMGKDEASQSIMSLYYDATGFTFRSILTNAEAKVAPPAFNEYMAIDNISSTLRVASMSEIVPEFTGPTPLGLYANWIVGATTNDFRVLDFIDRKHKDYVGKMKAGASGSDFNVLVLFQPVTQSIVNHGIRSGGNVLGLEDVVADGPIIMWLIVLTVDTAENQEKILPIALEFRDAIDEYAKSIDAYKEWRYLNYAWADQDPISDYGAENIALIKAAADRYDPKGVFQKLRKSGFKIPV
ncbi:hypothetical protein DL769_006771 [Monosporascus sp. CRB-8-3]|nr:hypothetical protein DL769_006771 [Monosporascus sp. CRB-8-3]